MPTSSSNPKTLAAKVRPITNSAQKEALSLYSQSLAALQAGDFARAAKGFAGIDGNAPAEVRERARMYLAACERQQKTRQAGLSFSSPEEQYDYAMACLNNSDYEEAREHLEAILNSQPTADFAHYGLGVLHSMTGQAEECLQHLGQAIEMNPHNRILARSDSDFRQMADDPRFTELLYPEAV